MKTARKVEGAFETTDFVACLSPHRQFLEHLKKNAYLVPHPLFRLRAKHTLLALGVPGRNQLLSKVIADVLHDGLTLGNDNVLFRSSLSDGNSGRFAQGVDGF